MQLQRILINGGLLSALTTLAVAAAQPALAQDATWLLNPTVVGPTASTFDFDANANWNPASAPTGTAFFGVSNGPNLSFSANTTINGWTFNAGASAYAFTNDRALTFFGAGIIINGGSAAITNFDVVRFQDTSTAGNATITNTNSGTVGFSDTSTAGNATITNNHYVLFNDNSTAGNASITNTNSGTVGFFDTSTAGNATITNNNSILVFFATSTAGNAAITNISGGAVVDFSNSTGPGNDHKLSAGSIAGSGSFKLGNDQLTVGSNNLSTEVSGVISGTGGSLTKAGTGTMILSGTNTYTGGTLVNAGVLHVDGSIASSSLTMVAANAALTGIGSVGSTQINANGMFLPGNGTPGSSMTVAGNLAFQSGALYLVQINPATASFANVTSIATLNGATASASFAPGSYVSKQYTILTANGGVSGTFAGVNNFNLPSNFSETLSYDNTHAYLNLILNFSIPGGLNQNQQAVGNALTSYFNSHGSIPMLYASLTANGLSQSEGEIATRSQQTTFSAMGQFMGVMTDPFIIGRNDGFGPNVAITGYAQDGALGYAAKRKPDDAMAAIYRKAPLASTYDPRWSVWAAGYGGSQTTDGNPIVGSNTATSRIFGTAVGADYRFSPFTIAGFALAGGGTNFSVNNSGFGRSDLFQAGAFVRHSFGQAYVTAAAAYGWQDITTNRTVTIAGINQLRAEFNANAYSGRVESGYRYVIPYFGGIGITPYAAGQFTTFNLPAYAEQATVGTNAFALAYASKSVTDSRSEWGIRFDRSFALSSAELTLRARGAWAHDFDPDRNIAATFQALPGASFVVNGGMPAHDSALTTASAELKWANNWSAAVTLEGEFSDVTRSYAGKGVIHYAW
jgi:autotransporter-associated beta strand protein